MADTGSFNLPVRLAKTLLCYQPQGRGSIKLSPSQTELAEIAGERREEDNRCLPGWQRPGILEFKDRRTIIRKPDVLRELVDSTQRIRTARTTLPRGMKTTLHWTAWFARQLCILHPHPRWQISYLLTMAPNAGAVARQNHPPCHATKQP